MKIRAWFLCMMAWLFSAAGVTAQEHEELPHHLPAHGPAHELTAEDVPDHEPRCITRWWVRGGYVLWLMKNPTSPPLITTGLNTDPQPGVLGSLSARVIYGGEIDLHEHHGGTFTVGRAFDDEHCWSLEATYAFAAPRTIQFTTASLGSSLAFPVLARPFFDAVNNREDSSLVAFPGLVAGRIDVDYNTYFDTGEVNVYRRLWNSDELTFDVLGGFRICRLEEELRIVEQSAVNAGTPVFAGQLIRVKDLFETDNLFWGGQIGIRGAINRKRWRVEAGAKIAFGVNDRDLTISGETFRSQAASQPAGLLALASNRGIHSSTAFGVLPEAHVQLGFRVTERFELQFGYSFLYWDQVLRPGESVDRVLNPNLIPTSTTFGAPGGPPRPRASEETTDFWLHGLRFGFEWRF